MQNYNQLQFTTSFGKRMLIFAGFVFLGYFITGAITLIVMNRISTATLRLAILSQDLFLFIFPAVAMALAVCRTPGRLLLAERFPSMRQLIFALVALVASVPAIYLMVSWNVSITLPESMAPMMEYLRIMEENNRETIKMIMGPRNAGNFIVSIMLVAFMAGLSEEVFFRGGLQRLLVTRPLGHHAAIWITAFIFSAVHMQFFGFVPRLLLGAFFGYLAWWSGSLWLPVIIHAVNNAVVVGSEFFSDGEAATVNEWGSGATVPEIVSVVMSVAVVTLMIRLLAADARRRRMAKSLE